ncbi:aldose 1-epimerase family protein [Brevibacterium sp. 91QC2O2]|uniref:aldose 1-epimerase family protein n=1 Tax=Brevibacterium sp. 91QC2O2 TaxID=2968458 RepID=UPI00211C0108|nr:aldose 1-epimerase family protein [Brevibacterium sp. 91QC2O2]MCQ9367397.1 aldose 1-epimerase family protein [Brevibacterium sp. 91QC2O2]
MELRDAPESVNLAHGDYSAVIDPVGAALAALRHAERDLILPFAPGSERRGAQGSVLAPWPNRIGGGRYAFAGRIQQLPLSEPDRGNAIHGLAMWTQWRIARATSDSVVLTIRVPAQPGYPGALDVSCTYQLDDSGLTWRVEAQGVGPGPVPYGVAVHPYLTLPTGRVDDWRLCLPAAEVLVPDPQTLLPRALEPVAGELDLRTGGPIGPARIDHAYTGLPPAPVSLTLCGAAAQEPRVTLSWDSREMPWVQVFTADLGIAGMDRRGLAVEPSTCPPDAFNSGTNLIVLEPGQEHRALWHLAAG